jgi:sporulation protein YlmC with PRC-barrel domain
VAVLRAEATHHELEFWRLGGDIGAPVDVGAGQFVAIVDDDDSPVLVDDDDSLVVVVSAGRLDVDAERCLSQSEGFLVDSASGDPIGIVNDVRFDARSGKIVELELDVSERWFGHRRLAVTAEEIVGVLPGADRLILDRPPEGRGGPRRQR